MKRSLALKMPFALAVLSAVAFAAPPDSTTSGTMPNTDRPATRDTMKSDSPRTDVGPKSDTSATDEKGPTPALEKISMSDKSFVKDAAELGMAEVQIAQLAVTKAANPQVKRFAQMMIDDHTKNNDELTTICARKDGVDLKTDLSGGAKRNYDKLNDLSGDKFDREFVNIMVDDHKKAVRLFEKASKKADAQDIKSYAARTLPALQHHLEQAQSLERDIKSRM
jgi:putative membrane protein